MTARQSSMTVARYIDLCDRIKDTPDGPELDKLIDKLDALYKAMGGQELAAVAAHYEAKEAG